MEPRLGEAQVTAFLAERYGRVPALVPLAGDASTRRYYRVSAEDGPVVLCAYPEPFDPEALPFLAVRRLLEGYGLPVPAVRAVDGPRGIVLQEDLGDLTLQERLREATAVERDAHYRQALEQLAVLQREAAGGPRDAVCFQLAFDFAKLSWEMHFFWKHFLEGHRGIELTVDDRVALADGLHRLCTEIASWPRVLAHRDFHSRNLMLHRGRLHWVDFQDARMGHATYDLASLLRDSYVDLPEDLVGELAEEFRGRAVPGEDRATFAHRFELSSIQRNLKALGTFGYQAAVRANPVYLQYVPRTLRSAGRNLARHPELAALRRALARHLEELS